MKNIIKKIICSLCLGMIMTGCSGVTDYRIILNNDYYIAKTSANNAKIFKIEDKDITGRAPSIPVYNKENDEEYEKESVIKVGQDSTYIIAQTNMDRYYILDTKTLIKFYNDALKGGRKSIPYSAFDKKLRVYTDIKYPLHYLEGVSTYLDIKEKSYD